MKICTRTRTRANSMKSSVFFSYDWSPAGKNEKVLKNFIRAYMGHHGKIHSNHRLLPKKANYVQRETNRMTKEIIYFFNFLQV